MKKSIFFVCLLALLTVIESGCAPTSTPAPTPVPSTFTPSPVPPTLPPEPTATPIPSPTPITYPSVLDQTFSNVQVLYKDDFEFTFQGMSPSGWVTSEDNAVLRIAKDSNVRIIPRADAFGDTFYFEEMPINPGMGVFFTFQYTGTKNVFTWGFDNINAQGKFFDFKTDGYYSFALQMFDKNLSAHVIEGPYLKDDPFKGSLKLLEGVWYNYMMAFDNDNNYIIKIWEPHSPENQLIYIRHWENSPTAYYFISWIGTERELWMDEFTVFSFDEILEQ